MGPRFPGRQEGFPVRLEAVHIPTNLLGPAEIETQWTSVRLVLYTRIIYASYPQSSWNSNAPVNVKCQRYKHYTAGVPLKAAAHRSTLGTSHRPGTRHQKPTDQKTEANEKKKKKERNVLAFDMFVLCAQNRCSIPIFCWFDASTLLFVNALFSFIY